MINKAKDSYYDTGITAIMWGALIAVCALVRSSEIQFNYKLPFDKLTGLGIRNRFYDFISPLFLMLYGLPTFVTGAVCKFKPMLWGGIFCWACCVIAVFTPIRVDHLLTAASAIVPGSFRYLDGEGVSFI